MASYPEWPTTLGGTRKVSTGRWACTLNTSVDGHHISYTAFSNSAVNAEKAAQKGLGKEVKKGLGKEVKNYKKSR